MLKSRGAMIYDVRSRRSRQPRSRCCRRCSSRRSSPWSCHRSLCVVCFFFFQAEDGIRDLTVTGVQTCALPIYCDNDGKLDIITVNGSSVDRYRQGGDLMITLYHQDSNLKFTDITNAAGLTRKGDRKSTRLNSSHSQISYAVFCLKKKNRLDFYI